MNASPLVDDGTVPVRVPRPERGSAMKALVVYESLFGNTEQVARAVGQGLRRSMEVEVVEVGSAPPLAPEGVDLLVVGAPTHAHGLSRPGTRKTEDRGEPGIGVREWLETVPAAPGASVAAFDTRFHKPRWITGSAARSIAARFAKQGCRTIAEPESFFVAGTQGPLRERELLRAARWGVALSMRLRRSSTERRASTV